MNNERLQWFRARVGKTVWRPNEDVAYTPLRIVIKSRQVAKELHDLEAGLGKILWQLHYFDTPEEVIEHEKTLKG